MTKFRFKKIINLKIVGIQLIDHYLKIEELTVFLSFLTLSKKPKSVLSFFSFFSVLVAQDRDGEKSKSMKPSSKRQKSTKRRESV